MLKSRCAVVASVILGFALCAAPNAAGQDPVQPPKGPAPLKLQLEKIPEVTPGSVAVAEGLATATPNRMWLDSLGISQPVSVTIASTNPAEPLTLSLTKDSWDDALHTTTTNGEGTATVDIRTQGEMGLKVTSASGNAVPFLLSVWVGDEVTPEMPDILVPVKDYSQVGGGWVRYATWGGIGLGVIGVVGLIFWLGRRSSRTAKAAVLALAFGLSAFGLSVHAQAGRATGTGPTQPGQDLGTGPTMPGTTPGAASPGGAPAARQVPAGDIFGGSGGSNNVGQYRAVTPRELREMEQMARIDRQIAAERAVREERGNMNVREMPVFTPPVFNPNAARGAAADARTAAAIQSGVNASAARFQSALGGAIGAAARLLHGYAILTASDGGCVPDTSPAGMQAVPSMCAGSAECRACYAQAYDRLNKLRFTFEKLRCVYATTKDIGKKGMSFGDTVSPIHGVSGLAWQVERTKIEAALKTLNQSYDTKYAELLGKLGQSMQEINTCEARYFGNPDWYARYGFMYQTFMTDRYKRQ